MQAKFEEKTYESYFNNELDAKSSIFFPPGQVQENVLGVDSTAYSRSRHLWRLFGYPFLLFPPFSGADLKEVATEMENFLCQTVKNIPQMKVNLLIQYKRPEYISNVLGKEWMLWNQAYFRYEIYKEQQDLLSHLETYLGNRALVIYAAPAINDINNLVTLKKERKIIENSNFKRPSELKGHHVNTYIKAGTYSQAVSEPKKIADFNLIDFLKSEKQYKDESNESLIKTFANDVSSFFSKQEIYKFAYNLLMEEVRVLEKYSLLFSFVRMKAIKEITGIQWLISF